MPVIRGADCLRRSLVPSLLAVRRTNEALANPEIELFEIAKVYLPRGGELPQEEIMLGITSGREYPAVKGVIEAILGELKIAAPLEAGDADIALLDPAACLPLAASQRSVRLRGPIDARGAAAVRSSRADHRGRNQAVAADRGGRPGAALRPAIALSGRDPRLEPGGRRGGPLGRRGGHGARERRPVASSRWNTATPTATPSGWAPARRACCLRSPCAPAKARSPASRPTRSATGSWPPAGRSTGRN